MQFVLPSSPTDPTQVDAALADEHAALVADHRILLAELDTDGIPRLHGAHGGGLTVYRGPVLDARRYTRLFAALQANGATTLTGPQDYLRGQWLRHWYADFRDLTPVSRWMVPEATAGLLVAAAHAVGSDAFVIRDSAGTTDAYAATANDVPGVVAGLPSVTDTVVVRAHEPWAPGRASLWWVRGKLAVRTGVPGEPRLDLSRAETEAVAASVERLGCPFVTTDVVRHVDGRLRVASVADGQTSAFPMPDGHDRLVAALDAA
ncbi:hypothetical protein GCM10027418_18550 [Mariniluteicoccus endophyticus]